MNNTSTNGSQKTPFYKKTWFIALMLIFLPPVGIIMMWVMRKDWNKTPKIILSVLAAIWLILIIASPSAEPSEPAIGDGVTTTSPAETVTTTEEATTEKETTAETTTKAEESTTKSEETTTETETTTQKNETTTKQTVTTTKQPETTTKQQTTTSAPNAEKNYVLNTSTKKFHYPGCSDVDKIKDENRSDVTDTRDNIISSGYSPCGHCKP